MRDFINNTMEFFIDETKIGSATCESEYLGDRKQYCVPRCHMCCCPCCINTKITEDENSIFLNVKLNLKHVKNRQKIYLQITDEILDTYKYKYFMILDSNNKKYNIYKCFNRWFPPQCLKKNDVLELSYFLGIGGFHIDKILSCEH